GGRAAARCPCLLEPGQEVVDRRAGPVRYRGRRLLPGPSVQGDDLPGDTQALGAALSAAYSLDTSGGDSIPSIVRLSSPVSELIVPVKVPPPVAPVKSFQPSTIVKVPEITETPEAS